MAPRFPAEYSSGKLILPNAPLASTGQPALVKSLNLPTPHENLCKWGSNLHSIASISVPKLQNQALAARTGAFQFSHLPAFSPTSPYSPLFLSFHSLAVR